MALRCGRLLRPDGRFAQNETVLVQGGKITAVGPHIDVPEGFETLDLSGAWVTPGIIESHGHINVDDSNEMAASPIVPHMSALYSVDPFSPSVARVRRAGVTAMCVLPGSGCLIGGTGAAVKLKPAQTAAEMLIPECQPLKMALGQNPLTFFGKKGLSPASRMGNTAVLRKTLYEIREKLDKDPAGYDGLPWPDRILADAIAGSRLVKIHCHTAQDIATAVELAEEFHFRYTLEHATEGYKIPAFLREKGVRCCLGPVFIQPLKTEMGNITPRNPAALARAGVPFSLIQDSDWETVFLPSLAGVCTAYGLPRETALRAITIEAARNLGLDGRMGSAEPGKDADIAAFSGDPLLNTSRCLLTIIDGILCPAGEKGGPLQ